jgi:acyl carrier protein
MLQAEIHDKLAGVIRNFFELPDLAIDESTTAAQVDGWDSVAHVELIVAVEKAFAVRFTTKEVKALRTVGDLGNLLARRTA